MASESDTSARERSLDAFEFGLRPILARVARHPALFLVLAVLVAGFYYRHEAARPVRYVSKAELAYEPRSQFETLAGREVLFLSSRQRAEILKDQVRVLRSPRVVERALEALGDLDSVVAEEDRAARLRIDRERITTGIEPSGILVVRVEDESEARSRQLLDQIVIAYRELDLAARTEEGRGMAGYLDQKVAELEDRIGRAKGKLQLVDRIQACERDLATLAKEGAAHAEKVESEIGRLESERRKLLVHYTEGHEKVREIDLAIGSLRDLVGFQDPESLAKSTLADLEPWSSEWAKAIQAKTGAAALAAQKTQCEADLAVGEETPKDRESWDRELAVNQGISVEFRNRRSLLELALSEIREGVEVLDATGPDRSSSTPTAPWLVLQGGLLGLAAAFLIVLAWEGAGSAFRTRRSVERTLGLFVLGEIPSFRAGGDDSRLSLPWGKAPGLVEPDTAAMDAYHLVAVNLERAMGGAPFKVLLTSSAPQEGKSTTTANLGFALARMGHETLLVSTNLRRPSLEVTFGLAGATPGVVECLRGEATLESAVRQTAAERLHFLPSGGPCEDSSGFLSQANLGEWAASLGERFSVVLFDSSPALLVADALILSAHAGGVCLVYHIGVTDRDNLERAARVFQEHDRKIAGVILNQGRGRWYGYRYRYGRYGRYYGHVKKTEEGENQQSPSQV